MGQIRLYKPTDLEELLLLQQKVAAELGIKYKITTARDTINSMYESGKSVMIVAEENYKIVGSIGAVISQSTTDHEVLTAQELGWYVLPEHRNGVGMQLFKALERLLKPLGVEYYVAAPAQAPSLARIFKGMGYKEVETIYKKEL